MTRSDQIRYALFWISVFLFGTGGVAQNLVPNPSFEFNVGCPLLTGQVELAVPWGQGNDGSADYFHTCAPPDDMGVPENQFGYQWPVAGGEAYMGALARSGSWTSNYREYIQAPLNVPLTVGAAYVVSFYVSLAEGACAVQPFGALFTVDPPIYDDQLVLDYYPQIEVYGGFLGNYTDWTLISRCFIAEGGENYITIGNFRTQAESPSDPSCGNGDGSDGSYYYIDSVSVIAMPFSESYFVLDPVTTCGSYTIDPGQAQNYTWGDGTTLPILTVTESGTYYVTLSDECAFQYGEIEVTIIPDAPPVDLPGDTMLCAGEVLLISLDPDSGTYQWQDGSNSSDYTISTEGMYTVALTDDCDVTMDTIFVLYLDAPAPFSLGEDTLICPGDALHYDFDPLLGEFTWQDGSISSNYSITDPGTYTLMINNLCGQQDASITVGWVESIDFEFDESLVSICEGEQYVITLDPDLGDILWHDGTMGNSITIENDGIVSVTISNICFSVSDYLEVEVIRPPEFSLGPDTTVCSGGLPLVLDLSGVLHAENYSWSTGNTNAIQIIDSSGTYSVTVSNSCFSYSDAIAVMVIDSMPDIQLPPDQSLCPGQSIVLHADGIAGSYLWQDSTIADTLLVTMPGLYALTVTTSCGTASDSVLITGVPPLQPPDLGADFSLCPGETAVLFANVSGVTYQWQNSSTADTLLVTTSGTYWLQITDGCTTAADTITIIFNSDPPQVDLPDVLNLCIGDTIVIEAGITGVNYLWHDGSVEPQYLVALPGIYILTVSNACGMDTDSVTVLDAGSAPSVMLGEDIALCSGETAMLQAVFSDVDAWTWHDGSSANTIEVSAPAVVYIDAWNSCGTSSDTLSVLLLPEIPLLDLGDDVALCPGETAAIVIDLPDVEIVWSDSSMGTEYIASGAELVHATISNACGMSSDTILITLYDPPPVLDLGSDQSLCPGETIVIAPGLSGVDYLWHDGSTAPVYETTMPGLVILTVSNACGVATDSLWITEDTDGPQINLGEDVMACIGDTVVLQAGISGVSYLWQDGSVGPQYYATQSGTYHLTVSNACGADADTVFIEFSGMVPMPSLGTDTVLCDGETLVLMSTADADTEILWQDGSVEPQYLATLPGTYILTETNHCGSAADTVNIDFEQSPPVFDLGGDVVLCPGDTLILSAPPTDALITWQDGSGTEIYYATQPQTYSLTLSNLCGTTTEVITVSFDDRIPEIALDPQLALCEGEAVVLDVTQPFDAEYVWSTGSVLPVIEIATPGDYAVSVSTDCHHTQESIHIALSADCNNEIYIPNIFSPNGDGINDVWTVHIGVDLQIISVQCRIFDRWGTLLHEATSLPVTWDGSYRGSVMLPGVYVYTLQLSYLHGSAERTRVVSGDVTLVR